MANNLFDLPAYFKRIGLREMPHADAAGLALVQRAHRLTIPFENLDIPLGRGISLDPERIFDKLVTRKRGGYCFEQNRLFLSALQTLGFEARPLLARVWLMASGVPPRTHTLNLVTVDGQGWIADAGFGGSYTPPMPLVGGHMLMTPDGVGHRLTADPVYGWMLERAGAGKADDWQPQYSFTLDEVWPSDLAMSNHFTATVPGGRFTTLKVVSMPTESAQIALTDRQFTASGDDVREIRNRAEYRDILASAFGIMLSDAEVGLLGLFD